MYLYLLPSWDLSGSSVSLTREVHWRVQWWWWWSVYGGIWVISWKNGTSPSSFNYAHLLMAVTFISYIEILISLFLWICLFYTINKIKLYTILSFLIAFIILVYMFAKFVHCLSMVKEHSGEKIYHILYIHSVVTT